jgi:SHS2 domain-containing protein
MMPLGTDEAEAQRPETGEDKRPEWKMKERSPQGNRCVPHTADVRIEAWAPSRERCLAEAVRALVETFADVEGAHPTGTGEFRVEAGTDEEALVAVLDEVIYRLDTEGELPLNSEARAVDGDLAVRWQTTGTDAVELVGAVPKAVSLNDLRFGPDEAGWSCAVTLDV